MSLPSAAKSLPSSSNNNLEAEALKSVTTKRLTTKQKLQNQKDEERRRSTFKSLLSHIVFECADMETELEKVILRESETARSVQTTIDKTSWHWLGENKDSLTNCSRSEIMKYRSAFTEEQWEGVVSTWSIVEERARQVENKEVTPLLDSVETSRKRKKLSKELMALTKEFLDDFDSIYDDTTSLYNCCEEFKLMYEKLDDTSESFKKHVVLDKLGRNLRRELKDILRGKGEEDGSVSASISVATKEDFALSASDNEKDDEQGDDDAIDPP